MINVAIHINGVRADLFDDNTIQIKDSIRKSMDVGAMFTQYTRPFKLPASKTNNKIFKHWYSLKNTDGFDARRKQSAIVTINGADYRKGYIKLLDAELKDNEVHTYNIQFYGELTTLKDRIGNDILSDLDYLDRFEHEFDVDTVRDGFETFLKYNSVSGEMEQNDTTGEIVYPFLTHTRGLQYNTSGGLSDITAASPASPTTDEQLSHVDLKPAIRLTEIITAIEEQYELDFRGDFLENTVFSELFMWCHRYKGGIKTDDQLSNTAVFTQNIQQFGSNDSFTGASDDPMGYDVEVHNQAPGVGQPANSDWDKYIDIDGNYTPVDSQNNHDFIIYKYGTLFSTTIAETFYDVQLQITPDAAFTADYYVKIINRETGDVYGQQLVSGGNSYDSGVIRIEADLNTFKKVDLDYQISSSGLDEFDVTWDITATREHRSSNGSRTRTWTYSDTVISAELITKAKVKFNMPKMGVMDFLRGLFKMFNLVAYQEKQLIEDKYVIMVEPYQEYLQNGIVKDITNRVDISGSSVERITPYKQINFDYTDKKTFLAIKTDELSKFDFGSLKWSADSYGSDDNFLYDGGQYSINLPFEKLVYERIVDSNADPTELIYGWFVNDFEENTPEPELGAPLVFYLNNRECSTDTIEWSDAGVTNTTYNAPSNVKSDGSQTLNFNAEYDEYTYLTNENSLFANYYSGYIGSIYDINARRYKVTAYLTQEFIWNYRLNDKIVINGIPFNIQELTCDLRTGKATLDLLKITSKIELLPITNSCRYVVEGYVDGYVGCDLEDTIPDPAVFPVVNFNFNNSVQDGSGAFEETSVIGTETYVNNGDAGISFDFDGSTYLETGEGDADINFAGNVPFSFYSDVSFDATGSQEAVISKITDSDYEYMLYKTSSDEVGIRLYTDATNYIGIKSTNTLSASTWYELSMTYDGSGVEAGLKLYIDGVAETPVSDSLGTFTGLTGNNLAVLVGAEDSGTPTNYFEGEINKLSIYNTELTAQEVAVL